MLSIDVHHHILPDFFWRETETNEQSPVGGIAPPPWSKESALAFLDEAGIDVAVTSISSPGVHMGDDARARVLARRCNELSAELVQGLLRASLEAAAPLLLTVALWGEKVHRRGCERRTTRGQLLKEATSSEPPVTASVPAHGWIPRLGGLVDRSGAEEKGPEYADGLEPPRSCIL
jgi:hypothetical protein